MQSFAPPSTENQTFYVYHKECSSENVLTGSNLGVDVIGTK